MTLRSASLLYTTLMIIVKKDLISRSHLVYKFDGLMHSIIPEKKSFFSISHSVHCTAGKIYTTMFLFIWKRVVNIPILELGLVSNGRSGYFTFYRGIHKFFILVKRHTVLENRYFFKKSENSIIHEKRTIF